MRVTLQEQEKKPQKAQEGSDLHAGTCAKVIIAQEVENIEHGLEHELLIKHDLWEISLLLCLIASITSSTRWVPITQEHDKMFCFHQSWCSTVQ